MVCFVLFLFAGLKPAFSVLKHTPGVSAVALAHWEVLEDALLAKPDSGGGGGGGLMSLIFGEEQSESMRSRL